VQVEAEKIRRRISSSVLALLLVCGTAQASNWVSLGKATDGTTDALVDTSSIRVAGAIRRAWIKTVYIYERPPDPTDKLTSNSVEHWMFNCGDETGRLEAFIVYYTDGTHVESDSSRPKPFQAVFPDTVLNTEILFICEWKAK